MTNTDRCVAIMAALLVLDVTGCARPTAGLDVRGGDASRPPRPILGKPIPLEGTKHILVPFAAEAWAGSKTGAVFISSEFYFESFGSPVSFSLSPSGLDGLLSTNETHWNNIVFYEPETGASHLLLDRRAVIVKTFLPETPTPDDAWTRWKHLLLAIAESDTNGDHFINDEDATSLYACDATGRGLSRLTPQGTQFVDLTGGESERVIYVRVMQDSDRDRNFGGNDRVLLLRLDLEQPGEPAQIVSDEMVARAMSIVLPAARGNR